MCRPDPICNIINSESLNWMKSGAVIVNAARGELIDSQALIKALQSDRLGGAALDVVEELSSLGPGHPLCSIDNVILTPHSAWLSEDAFQQCKSDLASELVRYFKKQPLKAILNPEVE